MALGIEKATAANALKKTVRIFSKRKQKNGKKEKESDFAGRDAGGPKGNGISPEGWLARHEQGIVP